MSNTIKLRSSVEEAIKTNSLTPLADSLLIGAVSNTAALEYIDGMPCLKYVTNIEGLKRTAEKSKDLASFVNDSIRTLSVLLAHVDHNEAQEHIPQVAWLIAGLSELAEMVADVKADIDYTLSTKDQA